VNIKYLEAVLVYLKNLFRCQRFSDKTILNKIGGFVGADFFSLCELSGLGLDSRSDLGIHNTGTFGSCLGGFWYLCCADFSDRLSPLIVSRRFFNPYSLVPNELGFGQPAFS